MRHMEEYRDFMGGARQHLLLGRENGGGAS